MSIWVPHLEASSRPLYRALAQDLEHQISAGQLPPGTRLPTHRELADQLGVTVGTVSRAYAEAARKGCISGEVGRGTFVRTPERLSAVGRRSDSGLIDLGLNHPPLADGEAASLAATLRMIAESAHLGKLLTYPPDAGAYEHRSAGAAWMARTGLQVKPENVVLSSGGQHGLTALLAALLAPGDVVATENLTYPGIKALARLLHLRLQSIAMDEHGLLPDAFEAACRGGSVKALYCGPSLQNPTASVMPTERRREVARLAREFGVALIEDDVYGMLLEEPPPPLASFAPELSYYVTGTAKSLAPGLRIGYVAAPLTKVAALAAGVRTTTWMAAPLMADIVTTWINDGTADRIVRQRRAEAVRRQRLAKGILGRLRYETHPGAYHLWLHLPEPWSSETFAEHARRRGVALTPSHVFQVGRGATPHAVRVCLGPPRDLAQLVSGLRVLADVLDGLPDAGLSVV